MEWYFNHFNTQSRANKKRENKGTKDLPVALAWPSSAQPTSYRQSSPSSHQEDERRVPDARSHTPATSCFCRHPGHHLRVPHTPPRPPLTFPTLPMPLYPLWLSPHPLPRGARRHRRRPPRPSTPSRLFDVSPSTTDVFLFLTGEPRRLERTATALAPSSSTLVHRDRRRPYAAPDASPSSLRPPLHSP